MIYERGIDGSYFHNNLVIPRDDEVVEDLIRCNNETITVCLNGYAIIPMKKYCELKGVPFDDKLIKETDKSLHEELNNE